MNRKGDFYTLWYDIYTVITSRIVSYIVIIIFIPKRYKCHTFQGRRIPCNSEGAQASWMTTINYLVGYGGMLPQEFWPPESASESNLRIFKSIFKVYTFEKWGGSPPPPPLFKVEGLEPPYFSAYAFTRAWIIHYCGTKIKVRFLSIIMMIIKH